MSPTRSFEIETFGTSTKTTGTNLARLKGSPNENSKAKNHRPLIKRSDREDKRAAKTIDDYMFSDVMSHSNLAITLQTTKHE